MTNSTPIHLHPRHDEPCPECEGSGNDGYDRELPPNPYVCTPCAGTGKIGGNAGPVGEVSQDADGWLWVVPNGSWGGPLPTLEAAATALRAAVLGVDVWEERPGQWFYSRQRPDDFGPHTTPDLAIEAAIKARRAQEGSP